MRKILLFSMTILLAVVLTGCTRLLDDSVSKETVASYVNDNIEKLEECVDNIPQNNYKKDEYIKNTFGSNTIIKSIYQYDINHI